MFYSLQLSILSSRQWGWMFHRRQYGRNSCAHHSVLYWTEIFCRKNLYLLYWQLWRIFYV